MLSIQDLSSNDLRSIILDAVECKRTGAIKHRPGVVYGMLFTEPSTRTYLSFKEAVRRLNGRSVYLDGMRSSMKKGESLDDTIKMLKEYCDIIILRSDQSYSNLKETRGIINAGDGDNEHPTQAIIDLFTIYEKKSFSINHICILGDAKHSRTIHSLLYGLMKLMPAVRVTLVTPLTLALPEHFKNMASDKGIEINEKSDLDQTILASVDVMYVTREQKERSNLTLDSLYPQLQLKHVHLMKKDAIILHPLPRGAELPHEIDSDPRALYMEQSNNGVPVRMAICTFVLKNQEYIETALEIASIA